MSVRSLWFIIPGGFVLIVLGVLVVISFATKSIQRRMTESGQARMRAKFQPNEVLFSDTNTANYMGITSRGSGQVRGNGVFVLTAQKIWFSRYMSDEELSIPLSDIQEMKLVDSHLGKRLIGSQLLHVRYKTESGEDSVAWYFPNPDEWMRRIESARTKR